MGQSDADQMTPKTKSCVPEFKWHLTAGLLQNWPGLLPSFFLEYHWNEQLVTLEFSKACENDLAQWHFQKSVVR